MSTTVDNRIVEMQFDNREFEINANASIKTLDKLKDALNMDDAARGFQEIDGAAKNIDMNPLMSAVQSVGEKFSAMDVVAITTLTRITNAAIDAGKRLVSSLSVDQINAGWAKYAEMTSSIQTIMGATAKDIGKKDEQGNIIGYLNVEDQMEKVSAQLEKLATYADETSYSLTDMTNNVGKFTSMNIPLNESVKAMQGIANWAAISGANSAQASRAMYNLSQALGMGSVRVQDWMSIENANMATYEFKEMVIAEAIAQGKLTKEGKTFGKNTEKTVKVINELTGELEIVKQTTEATAVTAENFRSTLAEGWFDTDVLNAVLSKYGSFSVKMLDYADELGGTATEWLEAIDDFNDANSEFNLDEFMSKLNDDADAEKVIEVLKELGSAEYELGRKAFKAAQEAKTFQEAIDATKDAVSSKFMKIFEYIFGNYLEAKELWTDLAEALYNIFAEPLNDVSDMFKEWRENGGREALWEGVYNIWRNIASVLGAIKEGFASVFPPKTAQDLLDVTNAFKSWSERMKPSAEQLARTKLIAEGIAKVIKGITTGFKMVGKVIGAVFKGIKKVFAKNNPVGELAESTEELVDIAKGPLLSLIDKFSDKMSELYDKLNNGTLLEDISNGVVFLADKVKSAVTTMKKALDDWGITDFLKKAKDDIVGFFKSFGKDSKTGNAAEESVNPLIKFGVAVKGFFTAIGGFFKNNFSLDKIKGFFENIKNFFVSVKDSFDKGSKDLSSSVKDFGTNVGDALTGAANKLSPAADFLKKVFGKIGEILTEFVDGLSLGKIIEYITNGVALKLLVDLGKLFSGIADFSKGLGKTMRALPSLLRRIGKGFRAIGDGVEAFGIGFKKLGKGIGSGVNKMGWAAMFKSFGLALLEFAAACFVVSLIPAEKIDQVMKIMITGFSGFAAVLMAAGLASKLGGGTGVSKMLGLAGIAIALGAVILKITTALKTVGELDPDQFAQGLYGVGAIIGLTALLIAVPMLLARQNSTAKKLLNMDMTKVLNKASSGGDVNYKGLALSLVATVYVVNKMVKSVETLGKLDEKSFSQGITGVAAIMGMTMLLMYIIGKTSQNTESSKNGNKTKSVTKNMKGIAKTFLALSIALGVVAIAVKHISDVPLPNMATAVGALTILGGVITAMEVLVSKFGNTKGATSAAGIGFGLLLIAGALSLLAIPIVVLSKALDNMSDPALIWSAVGALSALLAVISLAAGLLSKFAVGGLGVMGVAIGLTLMAVAITALTIPLLMLSKAVYDMDAETIWNAVGALSATVAVIGVLAGVLSAFTIGGLGVLGVGAGLILIAVALSMMANSLTMLANVEFETGTLWDAVLAIGAVFAVISALAALLSAATFGGLGVIGVGAGLIVISMAVQMLADVLQRLAATDPEDLWTAVNALSKLVTVISALAGVLSLVTVGGLGVLGVGAGIILIAIGLTQLVKPMQDIAAMGDSAWDSMLKMAAMLGGLAVAGIIAPMVMLLGSSLLILGSGATVAGEGLEKLAEGMQAFLDFIAGVAEKIANLIQNAWDAVVNSFKSFFGIRNSSSDEMEKNGNSLINGLVSGLKNFKAVEAIEKGVKFVGDKIKGFFNGLKDMFSGIGSWISEKIGSGMEAVGEFMDGGLANGISNAAGSIKDSVVSVATKTVDWFKGIFKIHSPSLIMEEMGGYVDQGLANGITKNSDVVNNATDTLGSGLIDKLKGYLSEKNINLGFDGSLIDVIKEKLLSGGDLGDLSSMTSRINDILNGQFDGMFDDISDDFTITPVLDLSEVEAGMSDLTNMTDATSEMALNASSDFSSYDALRQNGMAVDNSNVIAAINTLRDEVGALSQLIGKLNIVMDTGALVGQLTVPMDEALGKQLVYGNRGM